MALEEAASAITAEAFEQLLRDTIALVDVFPLRVLSVGFGRAELRLEFRPGHTRAGGTLNGPAIMTLVDTALYAAVLSRIGLEPLAVTSHLNIEFLRKPAAGDLVATAELLRLGRTSAVGTVSVKSEDGTLVAHATGAYALPRKNR